jgi:hypothetical protein
MDSPSEQTLLMESPGQQPSLNELMRLVLSNDTYTYKQKRSLLRELRRNNAGIGDRATYRVAIYALAVSAGVAVLAIPILAGVFQVTPPEGLIAIGSAAVGGLAGLLAPFQRARDRGES